jgi:hypothetical protein
LSGETIDLDFIDTSSMDLDGLSRERLPFYIGVQSIIIVYNVSQPQTFKDLGIMLKEVRATDLSTVSILIVANHVEGRKDAAIASKFKAKGLIVPTREDGEALAGQFNAYGYYEIELNHPKSISRVFTDAILSRHSPCALASPIEVTIQSGNKLVAKDKSTGKSDPFVKYGFVNAEGKFLKGLKGKTPIIKNSLTPTWHKDNSHNFNVLKSNERKNITGFKISAWDFDAIGKNDFLGEAFVTFGEFSDFEGHSRDCILKSRPGKNDRVDGYITIHIKYHG